VKQNNLQFGNSLQHTFFVTKTDGILAKVDIAQGLAKHLALDTTNTSSEILVQQRVASNGHFHFRTFNQIDGRVKLFELIESVANRNSGKFSNTL
jgi:hypothetical protein